MPASVGDLFGDDGVAHSHKLVCEPAMHALPVGRQLAFSRGFTPSGGLVAAALFPPGSAFLALLRPTSLVVALGIGGTPLPLHLALQPADKARIGVQFRTQRLQAGLRMLWHDSDALRSQIQADGVRASGVLGLVMG